MTPRACSSKKESGFALLLVFAMAATFAIMMYMAIPSAAFEAQRDREQLLMDRGHEYIRGIQLYVRKTKRFPAKIEDLENTNGIRFLRRQYIDPMTGKSEWRIIHAGPGGVLTDSLITPKDKNKQQQDTYKNTFITELGPIGGAPPGASDTPVSPGMRHRPSDQTSLPGSNPQPNTGPIPPDPPAGTLPTANNQPPGAAPTLGPTPATGNLPGRMPNSNGTYPGAPVNSQTGGVSPQASSGLLTLGPIGGSATPAPSAPAMPGVPTQVQNQVNNPNPNAPNTGTPNNSAAGLIQNLLTQPRPGGAPGTPVAGNQQQTIGGGIAGVATTYKGVGIKVYNDQSEYPKWEFVYDMSKDPSITGGVTTGLQQPNQNQNQTQGQQTGQQPSSTAPPPLNAPAPPAPLPHE